ncbi:hypothetical protein GCM10009834_15010 [Streptomonospora arabica]
MGSPANVKVPGACAARGSSDPLGPAVTFHPLSRRYGKGVLRAAPDRRAAPPRRRSTAPALLAARTCGRAAPPGTTPP